MQVGLDPRTGKFMARGHSNELEILRGIPNRRFDKESGTWICGPTHKNVEYFKRMRAVCTEPARIAMEVVEKGPTYKLGVIPPGFTFKTEPRSYQLEAFLRGLELDNQALLMDPGTGKTKIAIDDARAQYALGKINAVVVVCPNSTKSNWLDEIYTHSAGPDAIFIWEPEKRGSYKMWANSKQNALKWLIIGVESFSQGTAYEAVDRFLCLHRCAMYMDESSRIGNHKSVRTDKLIKLAALAVRRRIMTGTPFDKKGFNKAWAQYEFLDPNILDQGYYAFRNHFCLMGGYKGKQVIASINKDEFVDLIAPHTYRANKWECLKELPPKVFQVRRVEATKEQRRLYDQLLNEGMAELDGKVVTYNNTLVRDLRLQQIAGGFVALEELELPETATELEIIARMDKVPCVPVPGGNPKVGELLAYLEEIEDHKAIVWCRFRPEIDAVVRALRNEYGDEAVVEFHGGVSNDDRTAARRNFQSDPKVQFLVGQISTGGIGITLTAADYTFYFSNAWSLEDRIQSEDRNHRIGQKADSVTYIDIVVNAPSAKPWVDSKILQAIKDGKDYTEVLLAEIHEATR